MRCERCIKFLNVLKRYYYDIGSQIFINLFSKNVEALCAELWLSRDKFRYCHINADICIGKLSLFIYRKTQYSLKNVKGPICVYRGGDLSRFKSIVFKNDLVPVTLSESIAKKFAVQRELKYISKLCISKSAIIVNVNAIMGKQYKFKSEKELLVYSKHLRLKSVQRIEF